MELVKGRTSEAAVQRSARAAGSAATRAAAEAE